MTFSQSKFVLHTSADALVPAGWHLEHHAPSKVYSTTNIKYAVRFRKHADPIAERVFQKHMLSIVALPPGGVLSPKGMELYPFQRERGVPHILTHNKSYIAHQPGLGKSAQGISAVSSKPGRCLIICPAFLRVTWAREITKWFVGDFPRIAIVPETALAETVDWNADFIVCPDSMLIKEWVGLGLLKQKFRFIFVDEGHRYKTHDATRTIALFGGHNGKLKSPGLIYNAEHVSIFSGTPLLSRPIELWPTLYAMAPELIDFMPYEDFGFKYGGAVKDDRGRWRFVGSANEADLKARIMGKFMQVIKKEDVLKDLPAKIREVVVVDRDPRPKDIKALDQSLLMDLQANDFETPQSLGEYAVVRHEVGLAKVAWAVDFIKMILMGDDKESVIVFAHHRDVVEKLREGLGLAIPMVINGGTPQSARTQIEDDFQSGRRRLLIGNIHAMNLGLTLTKATRVVFVEYDWTPALNEQAEDRAHRIGQKDSVLCQYLVMPNSIDEAILQANLTKQNSIRKVMG